MALVQIRRFFGGRNYSRDDQGADSLVDGSSCGAGGLSPESIHRLFAEETGPICVATTRSDFDTVLYVRS